MSKTLRSGLKRFLPRGAQAPAIRLWTSFIQRGYAPLALADTFDRIYRSGAWGGGQEGSLRSGKGSTGRYAEEYGHLITHLLRGYSIESVADLGCGNFNTGKLIAALGVGYTGVDIAECVVHANTRAYAKARVAFVRCDLTCDRLPLADAAIVRQVLQHLTNSEVSAALDNVLRTYPLAFITEHVYIGRNAKPNLDQSHGPGTRVPFHSGVFIDQPPFNLTARQAEDIHYAPGEVLRTWVVASTKLRKSASAP